MHYIVITALQLDQLSMLICSDFPVAICLPPLLLITYLSYSETYDSSPCWHFHAQQPFHKCPIPHHFLLQLGLYCPTCWSHVQLHPRLITTYVPLSCSLSLSLAGLNDRPRRGAEANESMKSDPKHNGFNYATICPGGRKRMSMCNANFCVTCVANGRIVKSVVLCACVQKNLNSYIQTWYQPAGHPKNEEPRLPFRVPMVAGTSPTHGCRFESSGSLEKP